MLIAQGGFLFCIPPAWSAKKSRMSINSYKLRLLQGIFIEL
ncbi:hypothetical protein HMPREF1554_00335, partial [Porphyromonas gingivalis F0569]